MAMGHAVQEGLYLQMLQTEMGIGAEEGGTLLQLDNESAIKLAKNLVFHKRSKHIAIKYHFIREKVENKEFSFEFPRKRKDFREVVEPMCDVMRSSGVTEEFCW